MSSDGGCETDYDEVPSARVISKPKHTYGGKQRQRRLHQQPVRRESVRARTEDGVVRAVAGSSSDTEVDMRRTLGRTSSAVELGKRARSVNRREDQTRNDDGAQSDTPHSKRARDKSPIRPPSFDLDQASAAATTSHVTGIVVPTVSTTMKMTGTSSAPKRKPRRAESSKSQNRDRLGPTSSPRRVSSRDEGHDSENAMSEGDERRKHKAKSKHGGESRRDKAVEAGPIAMDVDAPNSQSEQQVQEQVDLSQRGAESAQEDAIIGPRPSVGKRVLGDKSNLPRSKSNVISLPAAQPLPQPPARARSTSAVSHSQQKTPRAIARHVSHGSASKAGAGGMQVYRDVITAAAASTMDLDALSTALPRVAQRAPSSSASSSACNSAASAHQVDYGSRIGSGSEDQQEQARHPPSGAFDDRLALPLPGDGSAIMSGAEGDHSSIVLETYDVADGSDELGEDEAAEADLTARQGELNRAGKPTNVTEYALVQYQDDEGEEEEGDVTVRVGKTGVASSVHSRRVDDQRAASNASDSEALDQVASPASPRFRDETLLSLSRSTLEVSLEHAASMSLIKSAGVIAPPRREQRSLTPRPKSRALLDIDSSTFRMPPRLPRLPLLTPRDTGPESDEDDLEYFIKTIGTNSSGEDEDFDDEDALRRAESEIGEGLRAGPGTRRWAQRYLLRQDEMDAIGSGEEDELSIRVEA